MADITSRVINILKTPKTEWPVIAGEHTDVGKLYSGYIAPLAAIGPLCRWIGMSVFGVAVPFIGMVRTPLVSGLVGMCVSYVLGLVMVYVAAVIIEKLAPTFKSSGSRLDALKLVAYASTPAWVAGVLGLIPTLGLLVILAALYGIYLFYLGVPVMMKTPPDQVIPYMIVAAIVMIVLAVVVGFITGAIMGTMTGYRYY